MRLARILRVAQRVGTSLRRDPRTIWAVLVVPIASLLLIGYVMTRAEDNITVALVVAGERWSTLDTVSFIEESLDSDDVASFRAPSRSAAEEAIRDGQAQAFVVIDDTFAQGVLGGAEQTVVVGVEGDNPATNAEVLEALGHALSTAPLKVFRSATGAEGLSPEGPIEFDTIYVYGGEDYDSFDHAFPALLAFLTFLHIYIITAVSVTRDRILHTLERLMATALRRAELMLGYMVGYGAVTLAHVAALVLVGVFLLRVHYGGNLGVIFLLTLVSSLVALNLGILLSAIARTEEQAMQAIPLVMVPQGVLCGVLFPLESLPQALEVVARFLPLTYGVSALRDVMIRDQGLFDGGVASDLAILLAFAAFFVILGARTLKREVA